MHRPIEPEGSEPVSDTLDLCCGGRKCPVLTDDGETIAVTDLEQSPAPIRFPKDRLPEVIAWLEARATR